MLQSQNLQSGRAKEPHDEKRTTRLSYFYELRQTSVAKVGLSTDEVIANPWFSLKNCKAPAAFRSEDSIGLPDVIAVTPQLDLHVHDTWSGVRSP